MLQGTAESYEPFVSYKLVEERNASTPNINKLETFKERGMLTTLT